MDGKKNCYTATISGFSVKDGEADAEFRKAQQASLAVKKAKAVIKAREAVNVN
jgi:hypothetical protein